MLSQFLCALLNSFSLLITELILFKIFFYFLYVFRKLLLLKIFTVLDIPMMCYFIEKTLRTIIFLIFYLQTMCLFLKYPFKYFHRKHSRFIPIRRIKII